MYKYNCEDQKLVSKMMTIGLHISNKGFQYMLEAAKIIHGCDSYPKIIGVYNIIAKKFDTTGQRVERCIRAEVERYYNSQIDMPMEFECDPDSGKLPNSEFLARLTNILYTD